MTASSFSHQILMLVLHGQNSHIPFQAQACSKLYAFFVHICYWVDCLNVLEAAELLVEILKKCTNLKGSIIQLMPPKPLITVLKGTSCI
jgi:hypothetical protein